MASRSVASEWARVVTSVDDGSSHSAEEYGEALDSGDKATAKAMSAAYKEAMVLGAKGGLQSALRPPVDYCLSGVNVRKPAS